MDLTCLLTGVELRASTCLEHTIPKKLGGRIRSRTVVASNVNNQFSEFDSVFSNAFSNVLIELGPAMAAEHRLRPTEVTLDGEDGRFFVEVGNVLTERGINILEKDEISGRPVRFTANSEKEIERIAGQMGLAVESLGPIFREKLVPATRKIPAIDPQLEVAILKSLILSFDHYLNQSGPSILRSDYFECVLNDLKTAVFLKRNYGNLLHERSWGVDHRWESVLGQSIRSRFALVYSEFTHWLYLIGDPIMRVVYLVFSVFGFETYRFVVNKDYRGTAFHFVIANDPINNGRAECKALDGIPPCLGSPTRIQAGQVGEWNDSERNVAIHTIDQGRRRLAQRACLFVQEQCDQHVAKCLLKQAARVTWKYVKEVTLIDVFVEHLWVQYEDRYESIKGKAELRKLILHCSERVAGKDWVNLKISGEESVETILELGVLKLYRVVLRELVDEKGEPGAFFDSRFDFVEFN